MTKRRILLKLILDEIGLGQLELSTFSQRLILQKKIYLLQLTGFDLGYRYNWYLRGPYCPALTEDAFALKEELGWGEQDYEEFELTQQAQAEIEKARKIWSQPPNLNVPPGAWPELIASLHYLKHVAYWSNKAGTKEEVLSKLKQTKPQFADQAHLLDVAWDRLCEACQPDEKPSA